MATKKKEASTDLKVNEEVIDGFVVDADSKQEEAEKHLANVRQIKEKDAELFVELAQELWVIRQENLFLLLENPQTGMAYASMKEFIEVEVSYSERKAHYLLDIHRVYADQLNVMDKVKHLGWTKLMEMIPVITADNVDHWIAIAEGESVKSLKKLVKHALGGPEDMDTPDGLLTEQTKRLTFQLLDDQHTDVSTALEVAQKISGSNNKSELLALIASDFLAGNAQSAGTDLPVRDILARIERNFGISLIALNAGGLIYGEAALERLATGDEEDEDLGDEVF